MTQSFRGKKTSGKESPCHISVAFTRKRPCRLGRLSPWQHSPLCVAPFVRGPFPFLSPPSSYGSPTRTQQASTTNHTQPLKIGKSNIEDSSLLAPTTTCRLVSRKIPIVHDDETQKETSVHETFLMELDRRSKSSLKNTPPTLAQMTDVKKTKQ